MYIFLFYLSYYLLIPALGELKISDAGIEAIRPGDVGIVFYFNIKNKNKNNYELRFSKSKCCEEIDHSKEECDITLLGKDMGLISPKEKKKITLIWPNMYVYNRKGYCKIVITYTDEKKTLSNDLKYKVYFDTQITKKHIWPAYKKFNPDIKPKCDTPDLDPLDRCHPVDCQMKYSGARNFFSSLQDLCESVPACLSDPSCVEKNFGYVPDSNQCKDLRSPLSEFEVKRTERNIIQNALSIKSHRPFKRNVNCNHGVRDKVTGFCKCHKGWTSHESGLQGYEPSLSIFHMCTVEIENWKRAYKSRINNTLMVFGLLSVLTAVVVLLVTFCLHGLYLCVQRYVKKSFFDDTSSLRSFDCTCGSIK